MRASDEIGDDAFHRIEEELDWLEMAGGRPIHSASET
jgi:CPA1 family monovalent cation:H+ antiporter